MVAATERIGRLTTSDIGLCSRYVAYADVAIRVGDVGIVAASGYLAGILRFRTLGMPASYRAVIVVAVLLTLGIFPACGVYQSWRGDRLTTELGRGLAAWALVLLATLMVGWGLKATGDYSRLWLGTWFCSGVVLFTGERVVARMLLHWVRARGIDTRNVLLVGATHAGQRIVMATRGSPWMGLNVIGYVATPYDKVVIDGLPRISSLAELIARPHLAACDQIWIALPMRAEADILRLQRALDDSAATLRFVPDLFGYELLNQRASQLAGLPIITLRGSRITGYARFVKGIEDRVLSALILALISPLMLLLAVSVKLTSKGPILFRQSRVGLDGRQFDMLKFRSMPLHDQSVGAEWGNAAKKRTTRIGRLMRRTSLDELPQFINVLLGEMSIVGPRPEQPTFVRQFRKSVPGYMQKHYVKAGITGLAQVNGFRGDTDLTQRIEYDLKYIRDWSLWLDIRIIAKTATVMFTGKNAY